jgi:hypothetical protein
MSVSSYHIDRMKTTQIHVMRGVRTRARAHTHKHRRVVHVCHHLSTSAQCGKTGHELLQANSRHAHARRCLYTCTNAHSLAEEKVYGVDTHMHSCSHTCVLHSAWNFTNLYHKTLARTRTEHAVARTCLSLEHAQKHMHLPSPTEHGRWFKDFEIRMLTLIFWGCRC